MTLTCTCTCTCTRNQSMGDNWETKFLCDYRLIRPQLLPFDHTCALTLTLTFTFPYIFTSTLAQLFFCEFGRMTTQAVSTVRIFTLICPYCVMSIPFTISTSIRAVDDNQVSPSSPSPFTTAGTNSHLWTASTVEISDSF